MSESQFLPSSEGPLASAYDADEASDCTYPSQLDLRDKLELLRWKYLEGTTYAVTRIYCCSSVHCLGHHAKLFFPFVVHHRRPPSSALHPQDSPRR